MKTYEEAVGFLDRFINYEKRMERLVYNEKNLDLKGFERFLGQWNNPHHHLNFIHIAGTKGKGSTAAMLEAALIHAGYRVGLYTSPHLNTYLERFRIEGRRITEKRFVSYMNNLSSHLEADSPSLSGNFRTVFELLTAMAFLFFRDENVDIAIMETGLGGRLDATNVIVPKISVITALGLDHTRILGEKITDIAREKGGIIKNGAPLVFASQEESTREDVLPVLQNICKTWQSPLIEAGNVVEIKERLMIHEGSNYRRISGQKIKFRLEKDDYEVDLPLLGRHQAENCRTAIAALWELSHTGFPVYLPKAFQGISKTRWKGRFEILPVAPVVILDGAHCPLSAKALVKALNEYFPDQPHVFLLGILKGKDAAGISREIAKDPRCSHIISFTSPSPRGCGAEELAAVIREVYPAVEIAITPEKGADMSYSYAKMNGVIVVTGSLYHLDMMKKLFTKRKQ